MAFNLIREWVIFTLIAQKSREDQHRFTGQIDDYLTQQEGVERTASRTSTHAGS